MFNNKKALQSHIYVIFMVSLIMTFLFVTIFSFVFVVDNPDCIYYDFEIKNKCKEDTGISFSIISDKKSFYLFNNERKEIYFAESNVLTKFKYNTNEDKVKITPYFKSPTSGEEFICKGKALSIDVNSLLNC